VVGEVLTEEKEPPTFSEIFDEQCPYYMAMGMPLNEFWDGDPRLVIFYRKAFDIKQDLINAWEWRMGVYNLTAFSTVIGNAFRKKGLKPLEYLEKPLPVREQTEAEKKAEQQRQTEAFIANLERKKMLRDAMKEQKDAGSDKTS